MRQIRLVRTPPQQQNGMIIGAISSTKGNQNMEVSRMYPYPPIFSNMAASIMDPATGASTWALGSHRWRPNTGTLTRKATRQNIAISPLAFFRSFKMKWVMLVCPMSL